MTEAQKFKFDRKPSQTPANMRPKAAYVEDEDTEMGGVANSSPQVRSASKVATAAQSSPALPPGTNVFDFLVTEEKTPSQYRPSVPPLNTSASTKQPYSYNASPLSGSDGRLSANDIKTPSSALRDTSLLSPNPLEVDKSDKKKRKRSRDDPNAAEDDTDREPTSASAGPYPSSMKSSIKRPPLSTGLTGGLDNLLSSSNETSSSKKSKPTDHNNDQSRNGDDAGPRRVDRRRQSGEGYQSGYRGSVESGNRRPTDAAPLSQEELKNVKRDARGRAGSESSPERQEKRKGVSFKAIEFASSESIQSKGDNNSNSNGENRELGESFLGLVTKGPESERGMSMNKVLKRYHREKDFQTDREKEEGDKELWKSLRLRRNEKGEVVVFI